MKGRRIFVAWDSRLYKTANQFELLAATPLDGVEFMLLGGPGRTAVGRLREALEGSLGTADGVLALVDIPNANVMWEVGVALARGLPVAFGTEGKRATWLRDTPLNTFLCEPRVTSEDRLVALMGEHERWFRLPGTPTLGRRGAVILPPNPALKRAIEKTCPERAWLDIDPTIGPVEACLGQLEGCGEVAWIVEPLARDEEGDGPINAIGALVAGFAFGTGRPVTSFVPDKMRELADSAEGVRRYESLAEIPRALEAWAGAARTTPSSPLGVYRASMAERLVRPLYYVQRFQLVDSDLVPIDLDVEEGTAVDSLDRRKPQGTGSATFSSLRQLVERQLPRGGPPRLHIRAEPGAGKTTLVRQTARALASTSDPEAPLPVVVSLAEWERDGGTLWDLAARIVDPQLRTSAANAVARLARREGMVWIFLDGFDEVKDHVLMQSRIQEWARTELKACPIVVTSRPTVGKGPWPGFMGLIVKYLDEERQVELVRRLTGQEAASARRLWLHLSRRPGFAVLLRNPFLLTLAVGLHRQAEADGKAPVTNRVSLLRRALDDCLEHAWAPPSADAREVTERWSPDGARRILAALSLELQRTGGESWDRSTLASVLLDLPASYPRVANVLGHESRWWKSERAFLDDLAAYGGVLGPLDAHGSSWRYLHRSLREMLAAEALLYERDASQREAYLSQAIADKGLGAGKLGQWGEVIALLAGIVPRREAVLHLKTLVKEGAPDAACRALATVDRLSTSQRFELLWKIPARVDWRQVGWDNDELDAILDLAVVDPRGTSRRLIEAMVRPGRSTFQLGVLWYALERCEANDAHPCAADEVESRRERFFEAAGLSGRRPTLARVRIEPGTFQRGSAERTECRPVHEVTLTRPFAIAVRPVSNEEYRSFATGWTSGSVAARRIDWFSARLFAAWLGGRLPTEAEWEYVGAAGNPGPYPWGEADRPPGKNGKGNADLERWRINPWGVEDMFGSVAQWCEDRFGPYGAEPLVDPTGPASGPHRVVRGGFHNRPASWRRASRQWDPPDVQGSNGIRVVFPV